MSIDLFINTFVLFPLDALSPRQIWLDAMESVKYIAFMLEIQEMAASSQTSARACQDVAFEKRRRRSISTTIQIKSGTDRCYYLVLSLSPLMTLLSSRPQLRHHLLDNHETVEGKIAVGMDTYTLAQGCWRTDRLRVSITPADIGILDYVCHTEALWAWHTAQPARTAKE